MEFGGSWSCGSEVPRSKRRLSSDHPAIGLSTKCWRHALEVHAEMLISFLESRYRLIIGIAA
jgi:hypothetical protein